MRLNLSNPSNLVEPDLSALVSKFESRKTARRAAHAV